MREALLVVIIGMIGSLTIIPLMFSLLADSMQAGIRTEQECKELVGVMKDNPDNSNYLKIHPERADVPRSQDCLEGLEEMSQAIPLVKAAGVIAGVAIAGVIFGNYYLIYHSKNDLTVNGSET